MFVDQAEIQVRSGDGGAGCVSFRREKYVPKGGPDGGDGGDGGDLVFQVDPQMNTLLGFSSRHHWTAHNGMGGEGSNCTGKSAEPLVIRVPPGTLIFDSETNLQLKDLVEPGQTVVLLPGGKGGLGNRHFASPTNQAPRYATPGQPGRERRLRLELKLIADVGLVGLPNAGKSTLLARTTRARPKIAGYPFTTLVPQLGIVELVGFRQYVMADLPGLIEGAHAGVGLGDAFLRHIERTRVIAHVVDVAPLEGQPSPLEAYQIIRDELEKYSAALAEKPEIIVANKMDLTGSQDGLHELQVALQRPVLGVSAVTGLGMERFHEDIWTTIQSQKSSDAPTQPRADPFEMTNSPGRPD